MRVSVFVSALVAALFLFAFTSSYTHAAVMGIDFGSEFIKVASVKPGTPFHIVVDEQSKRKVPAVVAFDNGERHFGNGAVQLAMRKPKETYLWAHRLLGKDINAPQVEELRTQGFPWEIVEIPGRRTLGFRHAVAKKEGEADLIFSVEEVVAMSLQHIMKIAEADAGSVVKDCVLTVPPFWTHRERQALIDAAEIAGLNVLSLLNENTAAAIQYGIDRKYNMNETHTVLFYNMGSTSTKVNLAHYSGFLKKERGGKGNKTIGQFEMRSMGYDESLGGAAFEQRITDFVAKEVNAQLKAKKIVHDIYKNPKAMAKIRSAAEKAKTVLSANQESQIFLNSLHEDTDFKMMITRDQFYELAADLLERVTNPIQQVLDESGVALSDIDAVVIIGGGIRVPAVQHKIKTFVQKESLTQSLNGDEAMVMGAVFRAANLSTTFQVRPFGMNDETPFAVGVRIASEASDAGVNADEEAQAAAASFSKRAALFKKHNRLSKKKTVQFTHSSDFSCQLAHEQPKSGVSLPAGIPLPLDHYNVTGVVRLLNNTRYADLLKEQKPKVSLSFLLDSSGIASLFKAEATLEEMVKVLKPKKAVKTNTTATVNATETDGAEKKEEDADAAAEDKKEEEKKEESSEEKKEDDKPDEPEYEMKKKVHTIPLVVFKSGSPGSIESMNATHKVLAKATLEKLRRADDLKKEIAAAKNTLEAYIYATRSAVGEPEVEPVSTEAQREEVRTALSGAEDWLYEQGDDSAKVFVDKLSDLKALADPIFFRVKESTDLPNFLESLKALVKHVTKQVTDYEKNRPWVPVADLQKLKDSIEDLQEWLAGKQAAQAKLTAFEAPVLVSSALEDKMKPIAKLSGDLAKIKKPIEKPKPKATKKKNDTDAETADATAEGTADDKKEGAADAKAEATGDESSEKTAESAADDDSKADEESKSKSEKHEKKDEL